MNIKRGLYSRAEWYALAQRTDSKEIDGNPFRTALSFEGHATWKETDTLFPYGAVLKGCRLKRSRYRREFDSYAEYSFLLFCFSCAFVCFPILLVIFSLRMFISIFDVEAHHAAYLSDVATICFGVPWFFSFGAMLMFPERSAVEIMLHIELLSYRQKA